MRSQIQRQSAAALLTILILATTSDLVTAESSSASSNFILPFWARSVSNNWPPKSNPPGLVLSDLLRTSEGHLILLSAVDGKPTIFVDPETSGPGRMIPLPIIGDGLRLAEGKDGIFWIGGFKNDRYEGIGSNPVSDAYLAKLDSEGRIVWERSFRDDTQRTIESLASLPSGAIVVSGRHDGSNWLARISPQGQVEWERLIGLWHGTSVSIVGDTIFLAGIDVGDENQDSYREDVVLWSFDSTSGNVLDRRIVRERVASSKNALLATIEVRHATDAIYVFSSGRSPRSDLPIEVAKLEHRGRLLWRTELAQTVERRPSGGSLSCLAPGVTLLDSSDPLIACALRDQVLLFRIGSVAGDAKVTSWRLPDCHHDFAAALFLMQKTARSVWILGSRPENVYLESCTWLGSLSVANQGN